MGEKKEYAEIELQKSDQVKELLESRHILDEEIKMVIDNAETTGKKIYQPGTNKFLAKMRIANATFYVEYSALELEKTYKIHTAYAHKAKIRE